MKASAKGRDSGFTLIETITSVVVIGIVMLALTTFFVTTVSTVNAQGGAQTATSLAQSAIARVRSMQGSTLLSGRDSASTLTQWQSPAPGVAAYLADLNQVADSTPPSIPPVVPVLPTVPVPELVNSILYEKNFYIGTCWQPVGGGACTGSVAGGVPFFRVVVAVTWPGRTCNQNRCSYVTATLVSNAPGDPVFNLSQTAKRPEIVNPGNQSGTIGSTVPGVPGLQLKAIGGAMPLTWSFNGLPPSLGRTSAGLISGNLPVAPGNFVVTVSVKDAFNVVSTAKFTWSVRTVPGAPTAVLVTSADSTGGVSWTAPTSDGNSPITGYTVTATPTGLPAVSCTTAATPTSCSWSNLVNGAVYTVTVRATNAVGVGPASAGIELIAYPSALLTKSNLSTWLDASATDKVLTAGDVPATTGQKVQTWNDRSGNNRNGEQLTASYQMTVGTLNGRQALTSTATTRYDGTLNGSFRTIVSVGRPNTTLPYNTTFAAPANLDNASQRIVNGYLPTVGGPYPTNVNDWSNGTGTPTHVWVNSLASPGTIISPGIFISESASTITNSFSISTGYTNTGGTRGFNGPLGEVIAFNRVLTSTERRQVEEYLARKWSISITP